MRALALALAVFGPIFAFAQGTQSNSKTLTDANQFTKFSTHGEGIVKSDVVKFLIDNRGQKPQVYFINSNFGAPNPPESRLASGPLVGGSALGARGSRAAGNPPESRGTRKPPESRAARGSPGSGTPRKPPESRSLSNPPESRIPS